MKYIKKSTILLSFIGLSSFTIYAQEIEQETNRIDAKVETLGTFSSGDNSPFWLTNNTYGLGSVDKNKQYVRTAAFANKQLSDRWKISGGLDLVGARNLESNFFLQQIYADISYRSLNLSIGMKERNVSFKNQDLFSGAMTLSNNARPIPQVEAGFTDFEPVPFTNGLLKIKGGISYGWYADDDFTLKNAGDQHYALDVLYHRKYMFLKFEKNNPWSFIFGLEMDTQFGGDFYIDGKYRDSSPSKLKDFFKVLIPMAGGSDSNNTDQVNIVGNYYGSWHFMANYKKEDYAIKAYHEHFFEDHSGMFFKNMPDGIYGLEFNLNKKRPVSSILFEYIHTKNQSGPFLYDKTEEIPVQVSAGDNYYNHFDYISISNHGFTQGSPLLTSPIYNKGTSLRVKNSRISAFHVGIGGYILDDLQYRLLLTSSRSWGTSFIPTRNIKNQFSSLLEMTYTPKKLVGWKFSGALAYDDSSMIGDNFGFQLKLSKSFGFDLR